MTGARLGFFTRLLEETTAEQRYAYALEQIAAADRWGFASAWIAQHHFDGNEGGLPSPFVLLAAAAERTDRIGLGTAVVTLPIDDPLRVAEDATVVDLLSGRRLQLGLATGGNPAAFAAFGRDSDARRSIFAEHLEVLGDALAGRSIRGTESVMYPAAGDLDQRIWQATFSADGGARAGTRGDGLMLSRTQPRSAEAPRAPLHDLQLPIIEAYNDALPAGAPSRVLASRTALVVDEVDLPLARELALPGLQAIAKTMHRVESDDLDLLIEVTDTHLGTSEQVIASLSADRSLTEVSDVSFQVHSIAATQELTLRSLELLATEVAPALGLSVGPDAAASLKAAHATTASAGSAPEGR